MVIAAGPKRFSIIQAKHKMGFVGIFHVFFIDLCALKPLFNNPK